MVRQTNDGGLDAGTDAQDVSVDEIDAGQPDSDIQDAGSDEADACTDDSHCPAGRYCVDFECVGCRVDVDCAGSQTCLNGECGCTMVDRCDLGGGCCPQDLQCVDRVCRRPCPGMRCGRRSEICCDAGTVCEDERCMIDCLAEKRCGANLEVCCGQDEICYALECTTSPNLCNHPGDCPPGHICDPDLGICIGKDLLGDCLFHPPVGEFNPELECRWTPPADHAAPHKNDVVIAPIVANLTDDNGDGRTDTFDVPDIAFVSYDLEGDGFGNIPGVLRIVSGRCSPDGSMFTHATIADPPLDNSGGLAVGDLDGDGIAEIVGMLWKGPAGANGTGPSQGTVAFKRDSPAGSAWSVMWANPDYPAWGVHTRGGSQPSLADLNGDGLPEVIVGNLALWGTNGALFWDGMDSVGATAGIGNNAFLGPVSSVADIDLDGQPEVLAGNTCYSWDGSEEWTFDYTTEASWCNGTLPCDGFTATGNFDDDPEGEVAIVRLGEVIVLHHDGSLLGQAEIPWDDCEKNIGGVLRKVNEGGPPTIADFDNDGRPEIGTAAADYYAVIDLDCLGEPPPAGCAGPGILWYVPNQDCSSRVTASSVFDFDGDGQAEAIYADETRFRIFDGSTGAELFVDDTHGSHTRMEMVVIADCDNDGNAEVVVPENASGGGTPGVEVWGDASDNWVYTRRIWNQHSYHVTNVSETGVVPSYEEPNWSYGHLNNFRQNVQGQGLFWAPDLVVINLHAVCETNSAVYVTFDVRNTGDRLVPDGIAVSMYVNDSLFVTLQTGHVLLPGHLEHFSTTWPNPDGLQDLPITIRVAADDLGNGSGEHSECENGGEDNNSAETTMVCESPS